jgi:hypothetical protein
MILRPHLWAGLSMTVEFLPDLSIQTLAKYDLVI